jgi:O-antigen/teichoic acid export membrane protein
MSETAPRRALALGLVFVGAATLVGNGAAYALSMVAARVLIPAEFGAFGALLAILVIVSTIGIAMQALAARRVAVATGNRAEVEGQALRLSIYLGMVIILGGLIVAWPLSQIFAIPVLAVIFGISSLGFVVIGSAAMGVSQGREEHKRLSAGFIVNGASRAIFGIAGVVAFQSVVGATLGILVGCAVGAFLSYRICCPGAWSNTIGAGGAAEFGHVAHALIVLFTLPNLDILMARIFLTEELSGEYSVGVLLAKIAFFLPNAIIIVLFPKMTAGKSRRTVYIATGLTAFVGLIITGFSLLFGEFVIRVLGGAQYVELGLGTEAWLFALEGSAFALVQVLLYARLAAEDKRAAASVWIALVVLVGIISIWRHDSVVEIVTTVVAVSLVLTLVGLLLDWRGGREGSEIEPIEMAE